MSTIQWETGDGFLYIFTEDMKTKIKKLPCALYYKDGKARAFARQFHVKENSKEHKEISNALEQTSKGE